MSKLVVPKIPVLRGGDYSSIFMEIESLPWNSLLQLPWRDQYPYAPSVKFQMAHTENAVILHYEVEEEFIRAQYIRSNENIWEDSCVEFFISLDDRQTYFNFEFNVLGAGLIGYGSPVKTDRERLGEEVVDTVNTYSMVFNKKQQKKWNIILDIPLTILRTQSLSGLLAHANFYKCGDSLPNPHFVAWNPIENPTPNFHLPQFFGEISFE